MDGRVTITADGVQGFDKPISLTADEFSALCQGIEEHKNWYVQRQDSEAHSLYTKLTSGVPQALLAGGQGR